MVIIAPLEIVGAIPDNLPETENPVPVAGKAVTASSYSPSYAEGDRATLAVDKISGGLLTHGRKLTAGDDSIVAVGDVAHDSIEGVGAPLRLGATARNHLTAQAQVGSGDRVGLCADNEGRLLVVPANKNTNAILSSVVRTETHQTSTTINYCLRGMIFFMDVTAISGAASVEMVLEGQEPSGSFYEIARSAVATAVGLKAVRVYPGLAEVPNVKISDLIPRSFRFRFIHSTGDSITYSATYQEMI